MRSRSVLGAAVIAAVVALSGAAPAGAVPGISVERSQAAVAGVDESRTGTLVLKFTAPNPYDDEPGPSNVGVGVELRRVAGVDLTTNEGWQQAADLTLTELVDAGRFDHSSHGITDANGHVTFTGLPLGLYLVTPTAAGAFEPFAVTLPITDISGTTWLYEVTAHPKVGGEEKPGVTPTETPGPGPGPSAPGTTTTSPSQPTGAETMSPGPGATPVPSAPGDSGGDGTGEDSDFSWWSPGDWFPGGADDGSADAGTPSDSAVSAPEHDGGDSRAQLAETGASVLAAVGLGALLLALGLLLIRRRPADDN